MKELREEFEKEMNFKEDEDLGYFYHKDEEITCDEYWISYSIWLEKKLLERKALEDCVYRPDNTTAMNCQHCGESKFAHILNSKESFDSSVSANNAHTKTVVFHSYDIHIVAEKYSNNEVDHHHSKEGVAMDAFLAGVQHMKSRTTVIDAVAYTEWLYEQNLSWHKEEQVWVNSLGRQWTTAELIKWFQTIQKDG